MPTTHAEASGRIWQRQIRPRWTPDSGSRSARGRSGLAVDLDRTFEYAVYELVADEVPDEDAHEWEIAAERAVQLDDANLSWIEFPILRTPSDQVVAHSVFSWPQRQDAPPEERLADLIKYVDTAGQVVPTVKRAWLFSDCSMDVVAVFTSASDTEIRTLPKDRSAT